MARLRAPVAVARGAAGGFPPELLDERDPAWVDDKADRGLDAFHTWRARQQRARCAIVAWGITHGLGHPQYQGFLDLHACRALAEAHGQHWPPRRIIRDDVAQEVSA